MRLAISNIAWDVVEDDVVASLLHRHGVDAIDIAPGKYFSEPVKATDTEIMYVKNRWRDCGIEITGMQALLFGTTGLNVFGGLKTQEAMLHHLSAVCRIGAGLGATRLVFGSPKNRDRTGLSDQEAMTVAVSFFRRLGSIAQSYGVVFCLEPNPVCYGANFMITSAETAKVVELVNHPAIKMQLDAGALTINNEDPMAVLRLYSPLIGHVHASEPDLLTLGDGGTEHANVADALRHYLPDHVVSIEMLAAKNELHEISIERALNVAKNYYRDAGVGAV